MKRKLLIVLLGLSLLVLFSGLSFAQSGSISGQVTDDSTGQPIMGAAITLSGMYCFWQTDSTGHYLCDSIPPGAYEVNCYATGYHQETYPESVIVMEGQNTPNIDFALTPAGGGTGSISGRVTDEETGIPLPMSHVWAYDSSSHAGGDTWSDTAGYYLIQNLVAGDYVVGVHKDGYEDEFYPELVAVEEGQNTPDIDFALTPMGGPEYGSITGQITDGETGLPIIMAKIRAIGMDNFCYGEAWSDTGGHYGILSLCPGTYQVVASKELYAPETYPDSVIVLAGQNTPGIDFALMPISEYGSISGTIVDEETGYPLSMAHLTAIGLDNWCFAEAWSDSDGYYLFHHLCPGIYQVNVNAQGYIPETYPDSVIVIAGQNTPDIDFALAPEVGPEFGSISGRVTDEETGLPLAMAKITITGIYCIWYTDTAGYYLCHHLPPGSYEVNAQKEGYLPETYPDSVIVIAEQNTPDIDFALTPTGEYGSISGRVTNQETGLPIIMAHLTAIGLDNWCCGEAWSDTSGYYAIQNMCAGIYQVHATAMGYMPDTYPDTVIVVAGENTSGIDFALTPLGEPGSISGTITDFYTGEPIPNTYVWAYGQFGHGYARTNSLGQYTIFNLLSGDYFVSAWAWDYYPEDYPTAVTVIEGEDTPGIDFALIPYDGPGGAIISGSVLEDSTLIPIPYAIIFAVSFNGNWGFDFADSGGAYTIQGLYQDDYYLFALAPGYMGEFYDGVYTWEDATLVTPDAYDINFYLAPCGAGGGNISGVISSDGFPIEGAFVFAHLGGEVKGFARSSSGGGYVINGLLPGTYTVMASKVGYHDGSYPGQVEVGSGKVGEIDIELNSVQVGDANGDGTIEVGDVTFLINYLYKAGPAPEPMMIGDVNFDEMVEVGDVVYLITYLFRNGPPPCSSMGTLLGYTGCKESFKRTAIDGVPPDQDCVEYYYDGENTLLLKHVNAGFNCCPDQILANITIQGNTITIQENESLEPSGGCDCLCLFDVDYQISNLSHGEYTIRMDGMYLEEGDEELEFTVDLSSSPSGIFCVYRDYYPWGSWY